MIKKYLFNKKKNTLFQKLSVKISLRDDFTEEEKQNKFKSLTKIFSEIEYGKIYKVVGYGSLLNKKDAKRTCKNLISHEIDFINGYRRIFNLGDSKHGNFLNVEPCKLTKNMVVAVLTVDHNDMLNLVQREWYYKWVTVKTNNNGECYMVVGDSGFNAEAPMLNYLHLCFSGVKSLCLNYYYNQYAQDDKLIVEKTYYNLNNFLNTTYTAKGVSLKNYLTNFNYINYMFNYEYKNR